MILYHDLWWLTRISLYPWCMSLRALGPLQFDLHNSSATPPCAVRCGLVPAVASTESTATGWRSKDPMLKSANNSPESPSWRHNSSHKNTQCPWPEMATGQGSCPQTWLPLPAMPNWAQLQTQKPTNLSADSISNSFPCRCLSVGLCKPLSSGTSYSSPARQLQLYNRCAQSSFERSPLNFEVLNPKSSAKHCQTYCILRFI